MIGSAAEELVGQMQRDTASWTEVTAEAGSKIE